MRLRFRTIPVGGVVLVLIGLLFLWPGEKPEQSQYETPASQRDDDRQGVQPEHRVARPLGSPGVAATRELLVAPQPQADAPATALGAGDESDLPVAAALDQETGWPYATRMRAEQALYESLNQPRMLQAAYMDQFACSDGKCRFELGLLEPMTGGNARVVSDFMNDLDNRLLTDENTAGVQVYLERFRPATDGTGLAIMIIDARGEDQAAVTINEETGAVTIGFPRRRVGDD